MIISHEKNTAALKKKIFTEINSNFSLFWYSYCTKFKFCIIMSIFQLRAKTMNMGIIMQKLWLKFCIHIAQFCAKRLIIRNWCEISCKTGFTLLRNWCEILCKNRVIPCKNTKLLRRRIYCFVETRPILYPV